MNPTLHKWWGEMTVKLYFLHGEGDIEQLWRLVRSHEAETAPCGIPSVIRCQYLPVGVPNMS